VFSTSLHDIETQLRDLDQCQRRQHGQVGWTLLCGYLSQVSSKQ
jgi:hypothetical protein